MVVKFIKRSEFSKDKKNYYFITYLYNDKACGTSFVDKKTYDWFENVDCGDIIPNDFCSVDIYERNNSLVAKVSIKLD